MKGRCHQLGAQRANIKPQKSPFGIKRALVVFYVKPFQHKARHTPGKQSFLWVFNSSS